MNKVQEFRIRENDITASLKPLIDEYFCGKITVEDNVITYTAESGQTFQITVTQI